MKVAHQAAAARVSSPGSAAAVRITAVEAIPYVLPYRHPPRFASGTVASADNVLVRIHTDSGVVGEAEAQPRPYTYGETQASIVGAVEDVFAPALVGLEPFEVERIGERCSRISGNQVARGAVDLAAWDAIGKLLGRPCSSLLGGFATEVPVAHMISFDDPAAMAEEALAVNADLGVTTFKVKVGRTPALDLGAVRAIREGLPTATIYADANRGWSRAAAARIGAALIDLGVAAIEEPLSLADRAGRRRLADRWDVPLIGDESCIGLAEVDRQIEEGAVGAVSVKTARTGFTESRRILGLCLGRAVPVLVASQYEGRLGALATLAFAAAFAETAERPAEITNFIDLADDLIGEGPLVRDGRAVVPTAPGLGGEVDEEALTRYRVDR